MSRGRGVVVGSTVGATTSSSSNIGVATNTSIANSTTPSNRRANRTLACFMDERLLDKYSHSTLAVDGKRKPSLDSQSSSGVDAGVTATNNTNITTMSSTNNNNSIATSLQQSNVNSVVATSPNENRRRRGARPGRARRAPSNDPTTTTTTTNTTATMSTRLDQHASVSPVQSTSLDSKGRENYWYYDPNSDGFYYEQNGTRGWRKRNAKLHGNPPLSLGATRSTVEQTSTTMAAAAVSQPQTIEKKVYVAVPIPVFAQSTATSGVANVAAASKFFAPSNVVASNVNKFYDAATDGYFYEMASVDGWRRRMPTTTTATTPTTTIKAEVDGNERAAAASPHMHQHQQHRQQRELTSRELEELVLSKMRQPSSRSAVTQSAITTNPSAYALNLLQAYKPTLDSTDYPSSVSTVSSSVSADDITPPPSAVSRLVVGAVASTQSHAFMQQPTQRGSANTEPLVGSFEEPYEFYWSDNERHVSSVSSLDEATTNTNNNHHQTAGVMTNHSTLPIGGQLAAWSIGQQQQQQQQRPPTSSIAAVKRPSSLKIQENGSSNFNVDRFIADLPDCGHERLLSNLTAACTPFTMAPDVRALDGSGGDISIKESPLFTPVNSYASVWERCGMLRRGGGVGGGGGGDDEPKMCDQATAALERGMRDIEKIWQSGF